MQCYLGIIKIISLMTIGIFFYIYSSNLFNEFINEEKLPSSIKLLTKSTSRTFNAAPLVLVSWLAFFNPTEGMWLLQEFLSKHLPLHVLVLIFELLGPATAFGSLKSKWPSMRLTLTSVLEIVSWESSFFEHPIEGIWQFQGNFFQQHCLP